MEKRIIILAAALSALAACRGENCIIEGDITGMEGEGWVYIQDSWNGYETIDSTKVVNGIFRFEIENPEVTHAYLYYNQEVQLQNFMIEPGTITVTGNVEEAWALNGTGTPMNDRISAFNEKMQSLDMTKNSYDQFIEILENTLREELTRGEGDAYRLYMIENSMRGMHPTELLEYFETLDDCLKSSAHAAEIKELLIRLAQVYPHKEGSDIMPVFIDMTYPSVEGNMISLASVINNPENKYVLLDFWATWCGPCRDETPFIKDAYDRFHGKGFEIYAVSCDPDHEAWKYYIKENGMDWVNVISGKTRQMPEWETYALDGIPANILIDCSDGIIIGRDIRGERLIDRLDEIL